MGMPIKMIHLINEIICENLDELKGKRIHLSKTEINNVQTVDPTTDSAKPNGLFYTMGDLWVEYLQYNPRRLWNRKYVYEVILDSSARIWTPKTYEDYYQVITKYPGKLDWEGEVMMDYGKMAKDYDGMEIFEVNGVDGYTIATSKKPRFGWIGELTEPHQGVVWNGSVAKLEKIDIDHLSKFKLKGWNPLTRNRDKEYSHDDYIQGKIPRSPKWSNAHQSDVDIEGNPVKWSPEQKCYLDWKGNPAKFGYVSPDDYKDDTFA